MKAILLSTAIAAGLLAAGLQDSVAQTPTTVSATCQDGTSYTGDTRRGACRGHGGVKTWNETGAAPTSPSAPTPTSPATTTATPAAPTQRAAPAAPGVGGAGQVWVNTSSKVYHCPGDRYYGKTKQGEYMSEADAKAKGFRADHGKACS
jgi:septal ring-binding cell division protein DamX